MSLLLTQTDFLGLPLKSVISLRSLGSFQWRMLFRSHMVLVVFITSRVSVDRMGWERVRKGERQCMHTLNSIFIYISWNAWVHTNTFDSNSTPQVSFHLLLLQYLLSPLQQWETWLSFSLIDFMDTTLTLLWLGFSTPGCCHAWISTRHLWALKPRPASSPYTDGRPALLATVP